MQKYKFFVQPDCDPNFKGGIKDGSDIVQWFLSNENKLSDTGNTNSDFASLSERLLLEGKKDFLIWDDILKAAEMTYYADNLPIKGPTIDFCCGYGFWTSRILGKIDVGVDLFPEEGSYQRTIEGFVENNFIGGAYKTVLRADVTAELPLPDNYFNSIIAVCSLEHIDQVENVLSTMARIVKPGGKIYLSLQTDKYIENFKEVFNPGYVQWVRDTFVIHKDRSVKDWENLVEQAGVTITDRRYILSKEETQLKAVTYWNNPFSPVMQELGLEKAVKEIPEFRKFYYDKVREWSKKVTEPDNASIVCLTCTRES